MKLIESFFIYLIFRLKEVYCFLLIYLEIFLICLLLLFNRKGRLKFSEIIFFFGLLWIYRNMYMIQVLIKFGVREILFNYFLFSIVFVKDYIRCMYIFVIQFINYFICKRKIYFYFIDENQMFRYVK